MVLTGFSSPIFQECINQIQEVHSQFGREVSACSLEPWIPEEFEGHPAIAVANRFFSDRRACGTSSDNQDLPFSPDVDPSRILQASKGQNFLHLEDNRVDYFEWRGSK